MNTVYKSRAASSVGVMYRVSGPNTGSNPGGGQIQKKKNFPFKVYFEAMLIY